MVFPPSKEAYEALVNEVKALKEELKRVRNVRSPAEVELKDLKTRDRKASRNEKKETSMNRAPAEVEVLNYNKCYDSSTQRALSQIHIRLCRRTG